MSTQGAPQTAVGIVGLGNIGGAVAKRLLAAGYQVHGLSLTGTNEFVGAGGHMCASLSELGEKSDLLIEALPNESAFEAVFGIAGDGLRKTDRPRHLVNLSSYPVDFKQRQRVFLGPLGIAMIDGEVSGPPAMVLSGQALIFLAGPQSDTEAVSPVISSVTPRVHRVGDFGAAAKLKLINNLLSSVHSAMAAEAIALACSAGIDPALAADLLAQGGGSSQMMIERGPRMARRDYTGPTGTLGAMSRYLPMIRDLAQHTKLQLPIFQAACELYSDANARGWADNDLAVLFELYVEQDATFERNKLPRPGLLGGSQ